MSELVRFGVSLERELLTAFDRHSERKGFANRSEALRHCIRRELSEEIVSDPEAPVAGVLTLVYDHHDNDLPGRLTSLQHELGHTIVDGNRTAGGVGKGPLPGYNTIFVLRVLGANGVAILLLRNRKCHFFYGTGNHSETAADPPEILCVLADKFVDHRKSLPFVLIRRSFLACIDSQQKQIPVCARR